MNTVKKKDKKKTTTAINYICAKPFEQLLLYSLLRSYDVVVLLRIIVNLAIIQVYY